MRTLPLRREVSEDGGGGERAPARSGRRRGGLGRAGRDGAEGGAPRQVQDGLHRDAHHGAGLRRKCMCSTVQNECPLNEFTSFFLHTSNLGHPMHSQSDESALTELPSQNLAPNLLLDPVFLLTKETCVHVQSSICTLSIPTFSCDHNFSEIATCTCVAVAKAHSREEWFHCAASSTSIVAATFQFPAEERGTRKGA